MFSLEHSLQEQNVIAPLLASLDTAVLFAIGSLAVSLGMSACRITFSLVRKKA